MTDTCVVEIVAVIGRSTQGATLPFLCLGEDGHSYYVKGARAGFRTCMAEWVAGRLAQVWKLPVPEQRLVTVSEEMVGGTLRADIKELNSGVWFGSRIVDQLQELSRSHVDKIDPLLREKLFVFDWWIHNEDRTLTAWGGNPNLFWSLAEDRLVVLDHNLAFDESFSPKNFLEMHAFTQERPEIHIRDTRKYISLMDKSMDALDSILSEIPKTWMDHAAGLNLEMVETLLSRYKRDPVLFWNWKL